MYCLRVDFGDFHLQRDLQVVSAPLPSDVVPCLVQPITHEVRSFGVVNKVFLSVGASLENSRIGKGETLRVSVASRNDTSVDLNRVRVKLVELIEYKALGEKATLKVDLEKLEDIDLPGLDKTKVSKEQVRQSIQGGFKRIKGAVYQAIYQDLVSGSNQFDIVVPQSARDTYDGNLISISHYLKITFFTEALAVNPSLKIPIVVGNARDNEQQQSAIPERQPEEPIATVIVDEDVSDNVTTVEVGSRAEHIPMAVAYIIDDQGGDRGPEGSPPRPMVNPSAPPESMVFENDMYRHGAVDDSSVRSDTASLSPQREDPLMEPYAPPNRGRSGYSPFQMYTRATSPANGARTRLPSYSYDTESGMASMSDTPQRLGGAAPSSAVRNASAQWSLERLLQELNGSIHDYEVVVTKIRDPGYKELFTMLTPDEYRRIIGHVSMSYQVQVALLLAKQLVRTFTCAHCVGALQKTSEYFRSNMVETLLPYCFDLQTNYLAIKAQLNDWEELITASAFEAALR